MNYVNRDEEICLNVNFSMLILRQMITILFIIYRITPGQRKPDDE